MSTIHTVWKKEVNAKILKFYESDEPSEVTKVSKRELEQDWED